MSESTEATTSKVEAVEPAPELLTAYRIPGQRPLKIVPAPAAREWIDVTTEGWANRCLPLRIANQAGWMILNECDFEVVWGGKPGLDSLKILPKSGQPEPQVSSMFGFGVVTWTIPFLFRTPPGYNLLVRGPANLPKDGASPMDAIVETDWLPYTFTMNWRLLRPLKVIKFYKDEPICMITPVRRGDVEMFQPEIRNLETHPELLASYNTWHEHRYAAQKQVEQRMAAKNAPSEAQPTVRQGHYIRGEGHLGEQAHGHQNNLKVRAFADLEPVKEVAQPLTERSPHVDKQPSLLRRLFGK